MKPIRVAITGIGAISSMGRSVSDIWDNASQGKSGISQFSKALDDSSINFGGEVKDFSLSEDIMKQKESRRFDRFVLFALHATHEAMTQASRSSNPLDFYNPNRAGVILGVGIGGMPMIEENCKTLLQKGHKRVSPFLIPSTISNMAPGAISIRYGLKGSNYATCSACASSNHAMASSVMEIMCGTHDLVVTGGAESSLNQLVVSGFANMKALSKGKTGDDDPTKASRPFDRDHNGFVMAEGSGVIILENYEKAVARGATIIAEVVGFGNSSDCHHITAPHEEGEGAMAAMENAIALANISPSSIDYINAHGTSTPLGDIIETKAIKKVFGSHAYNLAVSSTKSMSGHLLGAAGALESIFCIKALETGIIPPTINLDNPAPGCDLNYVPNKAIKRNIVYALNNSFGFGGTNSSIVFKTGLLPSC